MTTYIFNDREIELLYDGIDAQQDRLTDWREKERTKLEEQRIEGQRITRSSCCTPPSMLNITDKEIEVTREQISNIEQDMQALDELFERFQPWITAIRGRNRKEAIEQAIDYIGGIYEDAAHAFELKASTAEGLRIALELLKAEQDKG